MKAIAILLFSIVCLQCASQVPTCDTVYTIVDEMPAYKNGNSDLFRDLRERLQFNQDCKPEELTQIAWTINERGKIVVVNIVGLEGECEKNIIRQIMLLENWKPGMLKGKPVCTKITLPVHLRPN